MFKVTTGNQEKNFHEINGKVTTEGYENYLVVYAVEGKFISQMPMLADLDDIPFHPELVKAVMLGNVALQQVVIAQFAPNFDFEGVVLGLREIPVGHSFTYVLKKNKEEVQVDDKKWFS